MRQEQTHCVMRAGAGLRHQQRGFATLRGGAVPQPSETMAASAVGALISWASTYSDLSAVPKPTNLAFLLTNSFYFAAGLKLRRVRPESVFGDVVFAGSSAACTGASRLRSSVASCNGRLGDRLRWRLHGHGDHPADREDNTWGSFLRAPSASAPGRW